MAAQLVKNEVSNWLGPLLQSVAPITLVYLQTRICVALLCLPKAAEMLPFQSSSQRGCTRLRHFKGPSDQLHHSG